MLESNWGAGKFVCVGLDLVIDRMPGRFRRLDPGDALRKYGRAIVDATADKAAAFKPNIAYFEQYGGQGLEALQDLIGDIHTTYPTIPVIVDAKRGDIASSNDGYVAHIFGVLNADGTTLHPYLGEEALRPFLDLHGKGLFILCRTSNPGAGELQDLMTNGEPLYAALARSVTTRWSSQSELGLVVGATYPKELEAVRTVARHATFLIPGIGTQGGDLEASLNSGLNDRGTGVLINSSRGIIYASNGDDFQDAAKAASLRLHDQISDYRQSNGWS